MTAQWPRRPERTTDDVIAEVHAKTHELQELVDQVKALAATKEEEHPSGQ